MSRSVFLSAAALATAVAMPVAPALAQTDGVQADRGSITVTAPRVETEPRPGSVIPERTLTASALVYYDDLNLDTERGREALEERVELAAEETCEWLDEIYPPTGLTLGGDNDCAFDAKKKAEEQVDAAIAAYESDRYTG